MPDMTAHPSQQQLSAYSLGQLAPAATTEVESHISECQTCCDTVAHFSPDDTFIDLLKEARQLSDETIDRSALATSADSAVPEPLADHPRYQILELIGKGGMGHVYKAKHRMMERMVALKVINRELVQKSEVIDRFHREVKAAAQLSHPNIVTAYDAEQAGDVHFLVMEFIDGIDLSQVVKRGGALPIAEACNFIRQAAIGIQHAHEQGMVHRDIKPHNLIVTKDATLKVLDFGLASLAPATSPNVETVETIGQLTAVGAIMGTPDFISPEQADDARRADIRSDIYSLGTTLYFLISGRPPFSDASVTHKLKSHAQLEPEALESLRDGVPSELANIIAKMIAKDPDDRFQTPFEVAEAVTPFSQFTAPDLLTAVDNEPAQPAVRSVRKRRRAMSLSTIATLIAVIVCGVAFYLSVSPSDGYSLVSGGSGCGGEDWYVTSGGTYLKQGEPGVLFGMVEAPHGDRSLSYVVLLRHNANEDTTVSGSLNANLTFDGRAASIKDGVRIDGKGIQLEVEMRMDGQNVKSTTICIDGKSVDPAQGRLFLVDLTSDVVSWSQLDLAFPQNLPKPDEVVVDTGLVSTVARQIKDQFEKDNRSVRMFLAGTDFETEESSITANATDEPEIKVAGRPDSRVIAGIPREQVSGGGERSGGITTTEDIERRNPDSRSQADGQRTSTQNAFDQTEREAFGKTDPATPNKKSEIVSIISVGPREEYQSEADIVRYGDHFYLAFTKPVRGRQNAIQILQSESGQHWKPAAILRSESEDRQPDVTHSPHYKCRPVWFSIMESGRLSITGRASGKAMVWSTNNGIDWREEREIKLGKPFSRVLWQNDRAWCASDETSSCGERFELFRVESTTAGSSPETTYKLAHDTHTLTGPRESQLVFANGQAFCLLSFETYKFDKVRRWLIPSHSYARGKFGVSEAPYTTWTWTSTNHNFGHPNLLVLKDKRTIATGFIDGDKARSALFEVDTSTGELTEILQLPTDAAAQPVGMTEYGECIWACFYGGRQTKEHVSTLTVAKIKIE